MQLAHEPQGETGACLYFATYGLTHDPSWLAYARDGPGNPTDELLWLSRLAQAGVAIFHALVIQRSYADPVGPSFWEWQRQHAHNIRPGRVPLMVTFLGQSQVLYHAVALVLDTTTGDVTIREAAGRLGVTEKVLRGRIRRAEVLERLIGEHDAPAERVVGAVALDDRHGRVRTRGLQQEPEVQPRGSTANHRDLHSEPSRTRVQGYVRGRAFR